MNNRRLFLGNKLDDGNCRKHETISQQDKPFNPIIRCNYETHESFSVLSDVIANGGKLDDTIQYSTKTLASRKGKRSGSQAVHTDTQDSGDSVSCPPEDRAENLHKMVIRPAKTVRIVIGGQQVSASWGELRSLYEDLRKVFGAHKEGEHEQF